MTRRHNRFLVFRSILSSAAVVPSSDAVGRAHRLTVLQIELLFDRMCLRDHRLGTECSLLPAEPLVVAYWGRSGAGSAGFGVDAALACAADVATPPPVPLSSTWSSCSVGMPLRTAHQ